MDLSNNATRSNFYRRNYQEAAGGKRSGLLGLQICSRYNNNERT